MSLIVTTFRRDPSTGRLLDDPYPEEPGSDLAGFESWRTEVWGSEAAKKRGASFLPQLADRNLVIETEDLPAFVQECQRLLDDVAAFAREVGADESHLAHDLGNFIAAAGRAAPGTGGVLIA